MTLFQLQIRYVLFTWLLLGSSVLFAQRYNFKTYGPKEGLSNAVVNQSFRDSKGFLWVATQSGLNRFDGTAFINYSIKDGLPGNDIICINEDDKGKIWIGTNGNGLAIFDGKHFQLLSEKEGLANNVVRNLYRDKRNRMWIATDNGLNIFDGKLTVLDTNAGLPTNAILSVCEDDAGNYWIGTRGKGLIKYNGRVIQQLTIKDGLRDDYILSLYNNYGTIWIGTTAGVNTYNGTLSPFESAELKDAFIWSITRDKHNNLWLVSDRLLMKYSNQNATYYGESNGLSSSELFHVHADYEGNLWIGTGNGLNLLKNEAFTTYTQKEGLTGDKITAVFPTHQGLLIGTAGSGVIWYDGKTFQPLTDIKELNDAKVISFYETKSGDVWVSCDMSTNGLVVITKEDQGWRKKEAYAQLNGRNLANTTKVLEDREGNVWVFGFGSGIFKIAGDSVKHFDENTGLKSPDILTAYRDRKGRVWFSMYNNGVGYYDQNKFNYLDTASGLPDNSVWTISEDEQGRMYFGCNENGLSIYDGKSFKNYGTTNGLASNSIVALLFDVTGNLWMGTDRGVDKVQFNSDLSIRSIKHYNDENGLNNILINPNALTVYNSLIWIGTNNGLTSYNAELDYINASAPRLFLHDIQLFYERPDWVALGQELDSITVLPKALQLNYDQNHLTFMFRAITTDRVKYQFMLESFDENWSPLGYKTEALYTNIPPGDYTFKLKAVNSDGIPCEKVLEYRVVITPPFWQTWWFRIGAIAVLALGVFGGVRWRTARLAAEKKMLEKKVEERTLELKDSNNQLSHALDEIKDSISYAQRIQQSLLPDEKEVKEILNDAFVLFRPKDIVSGDFYWMAELDTPEGKLKCLAVADCTGHGVPGGFMTMLGTSFLNEIVIEKGIHHPGTVLDLLRERVIQTLRQTGNSGENKDGMDMVFLKYRVQTKELEYAGANNSLYKVSNGELTEYKPDKQPVGVAGHVAKPFTTNKIDFVSGDMLYLLTDGYPDQFGGPKGKKFKYKPLEDKLVDISTKTIPEQFRQLDSTIVDWMSGYEQVDDILLVGWRM